jgi:hypothetical protein
MQKLLAKFKQTKSAADALKLLAYLDKHPFAACLAHADDVVLIRRLRVLRACALDHPKAA